MTATITVKEGFKKLKDEIIRLATAVGQDLKKTNSSIGTLTLLNTEDKNSLVAALNEVLAIAQKPTVTQQDIENAITRLKNELMGGELDAQLDTLKEIGEKLNELANDDNLSSAIIQKFTEVNQKIEALENIANPLNTLANDFQQTDFVTVYNVAKGSV